MNMTNTKNQPATQTTTELPRLNTIGTIAQTLKVREHRIRYVIKSREYIRPVAIAGNAFLYDARGVELIRQALNGIDARRTSQADDSDQMRLF